MELKEVVNLRKLSEYRQSATDCHSDCPFREICRDLPQFPDCLCDNMVYGIRQPFDVYDEEAAGEA